MTCTWCGGPSGNRALCMSCNSHKREILNIMARVRAGVMHPVGRGPPRRRTRGRQRQIGL